MLRRRRGLERLRALLAAGAVLDATPRGPDARPCSAHARDAGGHLDAARLRLERGADVNACSARGRGRVGQTALMFAAKAAERPRHALLEVGARRTRATILPPPHRLRLTALHSRARRGDLEAFQRSRGGLPEMRSRTRVRCGVARRAEGHAEVAAVLCTPRLRKYCGSSARRACGGLSSACSGCCRCRDSRSRPRGA